MKQYSLHAIWGFMVGFVGVLFCGQIPVSVYSLIGAVASVLVLAVGSLLINMNWLMSDKLIGFLVSLFFWIIGALASAIFVLPSL